MELKHAHQKKLVDEVLLSNAALKREMMENVDVIAKKKTKKYTASEEEKLAQSCHFDYHGRVPERSRGRGRRS